jgi:glutamine synthetase
MHPKEILEYTRSHPSGKVKIAFADIDGILRGKYISVEKFLSVVDSTTGFCDVIFGWDAGDHAYERFHSRAGYRLSRCAGKIGSFNF